MHYTPTHTNPTYLRPHLPSPLSLARLPIFRLSSPLLSHSRSALPPSPLPFQTRRIVQGAILPTRYARCVGEPRETSALSAHERGRADSELRRPLAEARFDRRGEPGSSLVPLRAVHLDVPYDAASSVRSSSSSLLFSVLLVFLPFSATRSPSGLVTPSLALFSSNPFPRRGKARTSWNLMAAPR
jgi:hypothetical protein